MALLKFILAYFNRLNEKANQNKLNRKGNQNKPFNKINLSKALI